MKYETKHETQPNEWCHVCGKRSDSHASLWYPENAEHDKPVGKTPWRNRTAKYVRICKDCALHVVAVAAGAVPGTLRIQ